MKNMLLIHGWDYELYSNQTNLKDPWHDYKKLTDALSKDYNLYSIVLPGFCGVVEPKKAYTIDDYVKYVDDYVKSNNLKIDVVLGYSFGGAVATKWKADYHKDSKLFLVAPAIIRDTVASKSFASTPSCLKSLRNSLRNIYVSNFIKTPEMKFGTKFIKNSYQNIVRDDLTKEINSINPQEVVIVYGDLDSAVNPKRMLDLASNELKKQIYMIKSANHDNIITDYVPEVVEIAEKKL